MANELSVALGMISRGEAESLQYDSETGHFSVTDKEGETVALHGEGQELEGDWLDA